MKKWFADKKKDFLFILVFGVVLVVLAWLPTGFEQQIYINGQGVRARVLEIDNSRVYNLGLFYSGEQGCTIEVLSGPHDGTVVDAINLLNGKLEFDKLFAPGDEAFVLLEQADDGTVVFANMVDYYRLPQLLLLIGCFAAAIIALSGFTGVRTLLSFAFALLGIWKVLIPLMLHGYHPLLVALLFGNVLSIVTLVLVAGWTRQALAAAIGSVTASLATCGLAVLFGNLFKIDGAVMPWSESLLYAGFEGINLSALFQAAIYLACSGAILDLAVDIAAALDEVEKNSAGIGRVALIRSGMRIGRAVVGTQTTTLLLAYMGGFITIMMVYMAQGTPFMSILNSKFIASEILHTFVGCLGLVVVAPLTAVVCGFLFRRSADTVCEEQIPQGIPDISAVK